MDTLKKLQRLEMENIKGKFNKERLQREKEFNDHGVMVRELQKLMAEERRQKEQAKSVADNLQKEVSYLRRENENLKKHAQDMEDELQDIKQKLKYREEETSGMLAQLRQEVKVVRQNHSIAIAQVTKTFFKYFCKLLFIIYRNNREQLMQITVLGNLQLHMKYEFLI